jgi:ribosome biogenesis GTPase
MSFIDKDFLSHQGWDVFFEQVYKDPFLSALTPARVIGEERELYRVQWQKDQSAWASITGKMQYRAAGRQDFPAVGDWVLIDIPPGSDRVVIHAICPRKTVLKRQQVASSTADVQIIGSNIDIVYIATSMNEDMNIRRLHRYVTLVLDSGAKPVILLTKADLQEDGGASLKTEAENEFPGIEVHTLAMGKFAEADFFAKDLSHGKTAVVVGSSGVGKSTLVNYLIGEEKIKTQEIREEDGRGRHTTTSRFLFQSRFEGWVIDTPGMREISFLDHEEGLSAQFADIEAFLGRCRFSDCQHESEPGCIVQEALDQGRMDRDRWQSYLKLAAEIRHAMRKQDRALYAEDKRRWKKLSLEGRARGENKRRIK